MVNRMGIANGTIIETPPQEEQLRENRELGRINGSATRNGAKRAKRIWIDVDNSPHVPFFLPIIEELEKQGVELILTARNKYQVCQLLDLFHLPCRVIGGDYGKNKLLKVLGNCLRALQLTPTAAKLRPDLALSHGSRAQVLICKALNIPTMVMHDYEFTTKTGFVEPDWIFMPDVVPDGVMTKKTQGVLKYPGLKEDVYVPRFRPDRSILSALAVPADHLVVTLRPPATEAHYHTPKSDELFAETLQFLDKPDITTITLPRSAKQSQILRRDWSNLTASGRMVIPEAPLDGLNLIWFSDLVISGGGTMNREAAALGVPVYSIFGGKIGAVDRHLANQGRLILIDNAQDIPRKIKLVRWSRPARPDHYNRQTLCGIVDTIMAILNASPIHNNVYAMANKEQGAKV